MRWRHIGIAPLIERAVRVPVAASGPRVFSKRRKVATSMPFLSTEVVLISARFFRTR